MYLMANVPECGLNVGEQKNPDGTRTICVGCPFVAVNLCPNGDRLPFCGDPIDPNTPDYGRRIGLIRVFAAGVKGGCPGPQRP